MAVLSFGGDADFLTPIHRERTCYGRPERPPPQPPHPGCGDARVGHPGTQPHRAKERSIRFASWLTNEDSAIPEFNYDPEHRVFKTLAMGPNGPAYHRFGGPYSYGTWMDSYGLPFYDVEGVVTMMDLRDPEKARRYGEVYSARLRNCDTVTNMLSTTMVMNAYLHTGEEKYRQWVLAYVEGWRQRYAGNGGIMPDNAGPSGVVGETIDGKWYGGHYGWTFPHGFYFIGDALVIGGQNQRLLTGAPGRLRWVREQVEMLLSHAVADEKGRPWCRRTTPTRARCSNTAAAPASR